MVLDVGVGDEVIVPAYSFFATAGVVARLGAVPVFVDIDLSDYNIDPALIEAKITRAPRHHAVHLYGQCAPRTRSWPSQTRAAFGDRGRGAGGRLEYHGRRAVRSAPWARLVLPLKNLGAFGMPGDTTNDDALAVKLVDYRIHGMRPKYFHHAVGGNFRIDALQAAMLHIKLPLLESWHEGRRRNAEIYRRLFAQSGTGERVILPEELPGRRHIYNQYIVRFPEGRATRDRVLEHLKSVAIGCEVYYPLTLAEQECFRDVPGARDPYPHSDSAPRRRCDPDIPELRKAIRGGWA